MQVVKLRKGLGYSVTVRILLFTKILEELAIMYALRLLCVP